MLLVTLASLQHVEHLHFGNCQRGEREVRTAEKRVGVWGRKLKLQCWRLALPGAGRLLRLARTRLLPSSRQSDVQRRAADARPRSWPLHSRRGVMLTLGPPLLQIVCRWTCVYRSRASSRCPEFWQVVGTWTRCLRRSNLRWKSVSGSFQVALRASGRQRQSAFAAAIRFFSC